MSGYDTMSGWGKLQIFEFNDEIQKRSVSTAARIDQDCDCLTCDRGGVWEKRHSFAEGEGRSISRDDYVPPSPVAGTSPPAAMVPSFQTATSNWSPSQSPEAMSLRGSSPSSTPPLSPRADSIRTVSDGSPILSPKTRQERSQLAERLYYAACSGDLQQIRYLVEQGAPINEGTVVKGLYESFKPAKSGKLSPLAGAAGTGQLDAVELLILCGADINPKVNQSSSSPLHQACRSSDSEMARLLLDLGADVNLNNAYMTTPLMYAARHGSVEVIETILEFQPDLDSLSFIKSAAIHWAVWTGKEEVVEALLKGGAKPNHGMGDGTTPLHCAASGNQLGVARALLKYGADPERRNENYETPIQLAEAAENEEMTFMLRSAARSKK